MATSPVPARPPVPKPPPPPPRREFFIYAINFAVPASGTSSGAIQIQADSDFEVQKLTFFADIALNLQTEAERVLPLVTVQILDTGTGRQWFNTDVAIPALMGDGRIPFILPTTKVIAANSSLAFTLTAYAATAYNVRIALVGSKIFRYG